MWDIPGIFSLFVSFQQVVVNNFTLQKLLIAKFEPGLSRFRNNRFANCAITANLN